MGDALDYLNSRADVDPDKIGIFGFSAGGATATMAAARYPQIHAVITMGGYAHFADAVDDVAGSSWYRPLYHAGASVAYRLATGLDLSALSPISVIGQITPRPVLLIYGTREPAYPTAHLQLIAGGEHTALLVVQGGTHGTYWQYAPDLFEMRVVEFPR